MSIFNPFKKKKAASPEPPPEEPEPFNLDTPSQTDCLTIRNVVQGTAIFGEIGSGKSSGSGFALAQAMLAQDFGFLILTAKPDERSTWERYAAQAGRSQDVVVFSPENKWRFNFLDYEMRRSGTGGGLTENVVNLFLAVMEIADRSRGSGGDAFWKDTLKQLLRSTIDLISLSGEPLSLMTIYQVILSAPNSLRDVRNNEWRKKSLCAQLIQKGNEKRKDMDAMRERDFQITCRYFLSSFAGLNSKTKSIIQTSFSALADTFLRGVLGELFCTTTNIVPEVTYKNGAILIIDLPVKQYDQLGVLSQVLFKYIFQHALERRDTNKYPRIVGVWADEAQLFCAKYDREFTSTSRSSRVANVYLSQTISGYYASLGGGDLGKAESDSLLANFANRIFHANGCNITNNYAADLCGKSWQYRDSFSFSENSNGQGGSQSTSKNESLEHEVLPSDFMRLRTGGTDNAKCVDAIICKSGGVWNANGKNWLKTTFKQH